LAASSRAAVVEHQDGAEITLGMSTALSGPVAALGQEMRTGVLACFEAVNGSGGVNGRRLRLIALDDGYEPLRTAPNMRMLIERNNVLAVIGNVGTPTAVVAIPIAVERRTPFLAAVTGAGALRKSPPDRYVINYRASYAEEAEAMIEGLVDRLGLEPEEIAFFTQRDSYGDAGYHAGVAAFKRRGWNEGSPVLHVRYERNTLAVEDAVARLILARRSPRAIVMAGTYAPSAKFIRLCLEAGIRALFCSISFVGSIPLAKALGPPDVPVAVMQVVPSPIDQTLPLVRRYLAELRAFAPEEMPTFGNLEGYIAGRILVQGLQKIEGTPSREGVIDALEGLGKFDIGLGSPLFLSRDQHQACHRVWPAMLKGGSFVPLRWSDMAEGMKDGNTL
jgi:ABC-type branched-subunit amino acid transport system substrate-binding protein